MVPALALAPACKKEKKASAHVRCPILPSECVAQARARLACEKQLTWSCSAEYDVALPQAREACWNLHVECPPNDPQPPWGSFPAAVSSP
jgi:hypothetical protein